MGTSAEGIAFLCLEDDQHLAYAVRVVLEALRVRVEMVDRIALAKARLETERFDGLVLDVHVEDGDGLELLAWLRARGDRTTALVMTGLEERRLANRAQELGAEFVFKPFTRETLEAFVSRVRREALLVNGAATRLAKRYGMPKREEEILRAVLRGVARNQLARELGITENTLKTYVRRLLDRTEHASLDEVLRAMLRGAADDPPARVSGAFQRNEIAAMVREDEDSPSSSSR